MNVRRVIGWLGLCAPALLAGCSGMATPRLIGSYPRYATPTPFIAPARGYSTALEVEVVDVPSAAQQATALANSYGGYLAASQSWYQAGRLHASLILSVPSAQFQALRSSIMGLGRLTNEQLTSEPGSWPPYPPPNSTVSVTLSPAPSTLVLSSAPGTGWNPVETFAQAWAVFTRIFTVLVDVFIWVSVVVGPFVLMSLGLRWLVLRARPPK